MRPDAPQSPVRPNLSVLTLVLLSLLTGTTSVTAAPSEEGLFELPSLRLVLEDLRAMLPAMPWPAGAGDRATEPASEPASEPVSTSPSPGCSTREGSEPCAAVMREVDEWDSDVLSSGLRSPGEREGARRQYSRPGRHSRLQRP